MNTMFIFFVATIIPYTLELHNLKRRVYEHREKLVEGFTKKYQITKLLYYEIFGSVEEAILREKRQKKWKREWKLRLIKEFNPELNDLYINIL